MAWGRSVALLLLVLATRGLGQRPHPEPGLPGLWHSYDCGVKGMQLLVLPGEGRAVRFKVMDEFGNQFDVNNCSICYHWVSAPPQGPTVFSADYKGCHVLDKDGSSHLRVVIEAVLPNGRVDVARNVTLVCPKPNHTWTTPDSQRVPSATFSPSTPQNHPSHPTAEHSFSQPTSASPSLGSGPAHPTGAHPTGAHRTGAHRTGAHRTGAHPTGTHPPGTHRTWAHGSTVENGEVDKPDYIGTHLTPEQCQDGSGHLPCVVGGSKEACRQAGCCYDTTRDAPCYYGNTATVQCFRNGHLALVLSRKMALTHRLTLANVRLAGAPTRCSPTQETGSFVVFHFPLTHCGTTAQVVGNRLIYENQLVSDIDVQTGPQGSITRDSTFRLHIRCIFNASDFLPLQASVFPPPAPASVTQPGPLRLELRIAKDETFRSFYEERDYPVVRLLLEPVPLEVRLLQRTDPRLVLVLHQCWAAPSANPFQQPQWPILWDGCPFEGDSYRTRMVALDRAELPFPAHYQRFAVATFAFLDSGSHRALRGPVYFFCSASACSPSEQETCSTTCGSGPARQRRSPSRRGDAAQPQNIVSSPGPVGFVDSYGTERTLGPSGSPGLSDPRRLLRAVLVLVAVALVLGIGVFAGLSRAQRRQEDGRG